MKRIFEWLAIRMEKRPMRILLITIAIFLGLTIGISQIRMATGNDTLVKTSTEAYQSNVALEKDFGGDAVIVLFEGKKQKDLVTLENIRKMWNVEQTIKQENDVFTVISPATIVNLIADKQGTEIKSRLNDISDGLAEMSKKMIDLGNNLKGKNIKDPNEIKAKIEDLSKATAAFDQLINAQKEMGKGTSQLQGGMNQIADGIGKVSLQLQQLGMSVKNNLQLSQQLQMMAANLNQSSQGLKIIAEKTTGLQQGNEKTAEALSKMKMQLNAQTKEMIGSFGDALSPDQLQEMADGFLTMGEKLGEISDGLNTFHEKSGMMIADIPTEQKELDEILYDNGKLRSMFSEVILDNTHAMMMVKMNGNLSDSQKDDLYQKIENLLKEQDFKTISYMVSGKPVLDSALRSEMKNSMKNMVLLAVGFMFLVLMVVFKVRWRILSLPIIFFAVVATLGLMGLVNIPMTMVSMAVFPILIGLGVDYSIQFQNRYEEEHSLKKTLKQMGPAVGTAVVATILGFVALYLSPVPMVEDFGKMLTIGVAISYLAGIFILMLILYLRDHYFSRNQKVLQKKVNQSSILERILQSSTSIVIKFSLFVLLFAIFVTAWGVWVDEKVGVETDIETFMPQDTPQLLDIHKLRDVLGATDQVVLLIQSDSLLSEKHLNWIDQKTEQLKQKYPDLIVNAKSLTTLIRNANDGEMLSYTDSLDFINDLPENQRKMFLTEDQKQSVILLNIKHVPIGEVKGFIQDLRKEIKDTDMKVTVTGKSVLDVEMINGLTSGRVEMTFIGMGLVFLGLLVVYRNPIRAFIPVFPISLIVGLSGGMMYLLGMKYTPLTATLGALIIGIGTEFTILLLERYMEEREKGMEKILAIKTAVSRIGKAIIASGLTVIGGFSALVVSDFVILKDFGLMTLINMSLALFSTLVVLPPVMVWLDRWIVKKMKEAPSPVVQIAQKTE
ncbi:hydrophobe/amphiphile efflux-3 (HAE3) family transporter [Tepidibacillus fermentans]|uniref:Hydrophobe/amphiphile efflux-3 (HAE3) family protein n=1 Tax=Tepidibacillus fermentans TaxID=1281767 RepID=A0A4R3KKX5_9BACI|nr:hydrophobe/amphiphile efflux-3 (HAE3) family transporter [Tepidibacillus fermentans]TCS84543.1 hydrophobe/amphiphile efflux-3 (HAE3) family protein [Tepidibacillus fermentans]